MSDNSWILKDKKKALARYEQGQISYNDLREIFWSLDMAELDGSMSSDLIDKLVDVELSLTMPSRLRPGPKVVPKSPNAALKITLNRTDRKLHEELYERIE